MSARLEAGVQVTGGFWLLLLWFLFANGWQLLAAVLLAAAVHEGGHYLVLRLLGAEVIAVRISVFGAEMQVRGRLSYGGDLAATLAGPGANLLSGCLLAAMGGPWLVFAGAHLVLGCFNLLPIRPLDGGRALAAAVRWTAGPDAGEWAARWIGGAAEAALAAGVFFLMWRSGGSLWLLPAAIGLIAASAGEVRGKRSFL